MISLQKLYNNSFVVLAMFPLMSLKFAGIIIALWSFLSFIVIFKERTYINVTKKDIFNIIVLSALYLFYVANYLLTLDGILIAKLETCLSFLIFPVFLIINKSLITKKTLKYSLYGFFISNTILALLTWIHIFRVGLLNMIESNNYYHPVFRNAFFDITQIHLPYLGLFFVFSIFIGLHLLLNKKSLLPLYIKIVLVFICLLIFISILFFSARMALLSFIMGIIYGAYKLTKNRLVFSGLMVGLFVISSAIVLISPIKDRIKETLNKKIELPTEEMNDASANVNFRYGIYYCAYSSIKANWLFGVGKNNVQSELDKCYNSFTYNNYDDFSKKIYNSHNQYLDVLMSFGIFGLCILVISFFWGFSLRNELLYTLFLLMIFMALLTENIFDRQLGVVFFSFFNTLFFVVKLNK